MNQDNVWPMAKHVQTVENSTTSKKNAGVFPEMENKIGRKTDAEQFIKHESGWCIHSYVPFSSWCSSTRLLLDECSGFIGLHKHKTEAPV